MYIRLATLEDSAAIAHIQVDNYRSAYAGLLPQAYLDHFTYQEQTQDWRTLLSERNDVVYVAEAEPGALIGYALGRPGPCAFGYASELVALHVCRSRQKRGVGRQLIAAVANQLKQRGGLTLMLWVLAQNPARAFYEKLGGQLLGQQQVQLDENVTAVEVAYGWPDITQLCALSE